MLQWRESGIYEVGKDFVICILSKGIYRECVPNHIEQEGDWERQILSQKVKS